MGWFIPFIGGALLAKMFRRKGPRGDVLRAIRSFEPFEGDSERDYHDQLHEHLKGILPKRYSVGYEDSLPDGGRPDLQIYDGASDDRQIIEVKYDLTTTAELERAVEQVRKYALWGDVTLVLFDTPKEVIKGLDFEFEDEDDILILALEGA